MTEEPYDVDTDMGDDPEKSKAAEIERRIEADFDIQEYDVRDNDIQGRLGIDEEVRAERRDVFPRENWGGETRSTEEEAVHVVDDGTAPDTGQGAAARSGRFQAPGTDPEWGYVRDRQTGRADRTVDDDGYVPDAENPKDTGDADY